MCVGGPERIKHITPRGLKNYNQRLGPLSTALWPHLKFTRILTRKRYVYSYISINVWCDECPFTNSQEFQMQANVAHSADVTVELEDHTLKPSQLFVKKSASSSNINETKFIQRTATNPMAAAHSLSNTGWVTHVTWSSTPVSYSIALCTCVAVCCLLCCLLCCGVQVNSWRLHTNVFSRFRASQ